MELNYEGAKCFLLRLVFSILSGKRIKITKIRLKNEEQGIHDFEERLLKLLREVTNGSSYDIDKSGTEVIFRPGVLIGGKISFDCGTNRCISYYLQALMFLAPFSRQPIDATLEGITNDNDDISVDCFKLSAIPVLNKILGRSEAEINISSRGFPPLGGGKVNFKSPTRIYYGAINHIDVKKIKRIRGTAISTGVSPEYVNTLVKESKGLLLDFIPDVYIYTDRFKGLKGSKPGYGLVLSAETIDGVFYCGESFHYSKPDEKSDTIPEEIAQEAVNKLFDDIYRGGACSSQFTPLMILSMALCQADVSKVLLGPFSPYTIETFRHLKDFFQITFKLDWHEDENEELKKGSKKIMTTCVGIGFKTIRTIVQ